MVLLYIFGLNMALIGMGLYHDKTVGALKKEIETLKKPAPRRRTAVKK